jgi:hypothetical protein
VKIRRNKRQNIFGILLRIPGKKEESALLWNSVVYIFFIYHRIMNILIHGLYTVQYFSSRIHRVERKRVWNGERYGPLWFRSMQVSLYIQFCIVWRTLWSLMIPFYAGVTVHTVLHSLENVMVPYDSVLCRFHCTYSFA